jgi:hypothetical protein
MMMMMVMVMSRAAKFCWESDTIPAEPQNPQPGLYAGCADVVIACDGLSQLPPSPSLSSYAM